MSEDLKDIEVENPEGLVVAYNELFAPFDPNRLKDEFTPGGMLFSRVFPVVLRTEEGQEVPFRFEVGNITDPENGDKGTNYAKDETFLPFYPDQGVSITMEDSTPEGRRKKGTDPNFRDPDHGEPEHIPLSLCNGWVTLGLDFRRLEEFGLDKSDEKLLEALGLTHIQLHFPPGEWKEAGADRRVSPTNFQGSFLHPFKAIYHYYPLDSGPLPTGDTYFPKYHIYSEWENGHNIGVRNDELVKLAMVRARFVRAPSTFIRSTGRLKQ